MMHIYSYFFLPFTFKDVLFVNSGDPWNPRPATVTQVKAMLDGVHRVLKPDGIFISISFGQVEQRNSSFLLWSLRLISPYVIVTHMKFISAATL